MDEPDRNRPCDADHRKIPFRIGSASGDTRSTAVTVAPVGSQFAAGRRSPGWGGFRARSATDSETGAVTGRKRPEGTGISPCPVWTDWSDVAPDCRGSAGGVAWPGAAPTTCSRGRTGPSRLLRGGVPEARRGASWDYGWDYRGTRFGPERRRFLHPPAAVVPLRGEMPPRRVSRPEPQSA